MSMKSVVKSANAGNGSHSKPAYCPKPSNSGPNGRVGSMSKVKGVAHTGKR